MPSDLNSLLGPQPLVITRATCDSAFRSVPYQPLPPSTRASADARSSPGALSVEANVMAAYFRHFLAENLVRIAR